MFFTKNGKIFSVSNIQGDCCTGGHSLDVNLCGGMPSSAACRCLSVRKWSCTHACTWCEDGGHACVHTVCA